MAPQTIDARRCVSYLTIERPGARRLGGRRAIGDWVFGCDVCQEVCPVNAEADDPGALRVPLLPLIAWLLPISASGFERAVRATALTRAGRHRLLRNAIAALGIPERPAGADALLHLAGARDWQAEVRAQATRVLGRSA